MTLAAGVQDRNRVPGSGMATSGRVRSGTPAGLTVTSFGLSPQGKPLSASVGHSRGEQSFQSSSSLEDKPVPLLTGREATPRLQNSAGRLSTGPSCPRGPPLHRAPALSRPVLPRGHQASPTRGQLLMPTKPRRSGFAGERRCGEVRGALCSQAPPVWNCPLWTAW